MVAFDVCGWDDAAVERLRGGFPTRVAVDVDPIVSIRHAFQKPGARAI